MWMDLPSWAQSHYHRYTQSPLSHGSSQAAECDMLRLPNMSIRDEGMNAWTNDMTGVTYQPWGDRNNLIHNHKTIYCSLFKKEKANKCWDMRRVSEVCWNPKGREEDREDVCVHISKVLGGAALCHGMSFKWSNAVAWSHRKFTTLAGFCAPNSVQYLLIIYMIKRNA